MKTASKRTPRLRQTALVVHRYVGLFLTVFVVVAGLTGILLAFYEELDEIINPEIHFVPAEERALPLLDPFELAARVQAAMPSGQTFRSVGFDTEPGHTVSAWVEESPDEWREWFVSPHTGRVVVKRNWGDLSEGKVNLMTFIYRLHYSLALDDVGIVLFGIAALLWTIDCFVGAYLTFPQPGPGGGRAPGTFLRRWLPAWAVRTNKLFSAVFTWHRASGLWIWALLFVFAWSGVGFNLPPVYQPVMKGLLGMQSSGHDLLPHLEPPFAAPKLDPREAHARAKEELARLAKERGFTIGRESYLYYADDHGAYAYGVKSSLDISERASGTEVYIDGQSGKLLGFSAPTGLGAGNTVSSWLFALHMGTAFGTWYRVVVALVGLLVAVLGVTGVWIWWRKRQQRLARAARGASAAPESDDSFPSSDSFGSRGSEPQVAQRVAG